MIKGLMPTVFVSNLDRSVEFYRDVLCLKVDMHIPGHWASLSAPDGSKIGLHPAGPESPKPGSHGGIQIGFSTKQPLEQWETQLKQKGVRIQKPIKDDGALRLLFVPDPDGNDLYLAEMKSWEK